MIIRPTFRRLRRQPPGRGFFPCLTTDTTETKSNPLAFKDRQRPWSSTSSITPSPQPALRLSSIIEPPLDSAIKEKPCTVVLMEDEIDIRTRTYSDSEIDRTTTESWSPMFQAKIPTEYGMSFASISFPEEQSDKCCGIQQQQDPLTIVECVNALKTSDLPKMTDAVLVARGWFSSLCALYYLESYPLRGLIMVNPLSFHLDDVDDDVQHQSFPQFILHENWRRFENCDPLWLEPNAVPMMVVSTIPTTPWLRAAHNVADRHSDEDGPYGMVPVINLNQLDQIELQKSENYLTVEDAKRSFSLGGKDRHADDIMIYFMNQWIEKEVL
jgi:hypothetical protein